MTTVEALLSLLALHEPPYEQRAEPENKDATSDLVLKDLSEWEKLKNVPHKKSALAKGKPKKLPEVKTFNLRSSLPEYLEGKQSDSMGVGDD